MINPNDINTVRVGKLPPAQPNLSDNFPHEIGTELHKATLQQLADLIKDYIGTVSSLAFNPTTVPNGGTLPITTTTEWILLGTGTFHNVAGFPDIVTTEELNALVSNGTSWSIGVEIPIDVELAGIVQTIRSGYLQTTPSENSVYNALALKANISDLPNTDNKLDKVSTVTPNAQAYVKRADGSQTMFDIDEISTESIYGSPAYGGSFDAYPFDRTILSGLEGSISSSASIKNYLDALYCWGDSMTFGTGSTTGNDYPNILSKSVNWKIVNNGVPGETSTQIKNRFVSFYIANPNELKKPVIIWAGRNNYSDGATIKADVSTMVAMLPHKNYLIIGVTNSNPGEPIGNSGYTQIVTLNNDLKTLYGSRFLDVRKWLVANYNPSLPQDVIDFGLDLPPTSLLSDNIHLNNKGYRLVSDLICKSFPYISNESDILFESINARNLFLPNVTASILKTGVNGQVTNSVLYEKGLNIGLALTPTDTPDTQNVELINGASLMGRIAVPQFAISSNAVGTFYGSKYKLSNFASQILLNGNAGDVEIRTAASGSAGSDITWLRKFWLKQNGQIEIANLSGTGIRTVVADASGNLSATSTPPDSRPYKVYTALLSQTETSAPTSTILENTIGSIVWSRISTGLYRGTLTGAFVLNKSGAFIGNSGSPFNSDQKVFIPTVDYVSVATLQSGTVVDGLLNSTMIEIRIYN